MADNGSHISRDLITEHSLCCIIHLWAGSPLPQLTDYMPFSLEGEGGHLKFPLKKEEGLLNGSRITMRILHHLLHHLCNITMRILPNLLPLPDLQTTGVKSRWG